MKKYIIKTAGEIKKIVLVRYSVEYADGVMYFTNKEETVFFIKELESQSIEYSVTEYDITRYISLENQEIKSYEEAEELFSAFDTVVGAKKAKIYALDLYDKSENVSSFYLNGNPVWIDGFTRLQLKNRISVEQEAGKEKTKIWIDNVPVELTVSNAQSMLKLVEMYAIECFDRTEEHRSNIMSLEDINDIMNYDFTTGYPEKINLKY